MSLTGGMRLYALYESGSKLRRHQLQASLLMKMGNKKATLFLCIEIRVRVKDIRTINWVEYIRFYLFCMLEYSMELLSLVSQSSRVGGNPYTTFI